jgi:hypothetical protein
VTVFVCSVHPPQVFLPASRIAFDLLCYHRCIWVENGSFYGMGYIDNSADIESLDDVKDSLTAYTHTHYIMQLIISYICKYPKKVVAMNDKRVSY